MEVTGKKGWTSARINKKGATKKTPFKLLYIAKSSKFHKFYVTALCYYAKKLERKRILVSGDAGGEILISKFEIDENKGKLLQMEPIYRKRAHEGWVSSLIKYGPYDIVVSSSHDSSIK